MKKKNIIEKIGSIKEDKKLVLVMKNKIDEKVEKIRRRKSKEFRKNNPGESDFCKNIFDCTHGTFFVPGRSPGYRFSF